MIGFPTVGTGNDFLLAVVLAKAVLPEQLFHIGDCILVVFRISLNGQCNGFFFSIFIRYRLGIVIDILPVKIIPEIQTGFGLTEPAYQTKLLIKIQRHQGIAFLVFLSLPQAGAEGRLDIGLFILFQRVCRINLLQCGDSFHRCTAAGARAFRLCCSTARHGKQHTGRKQHRTDFLE